VTAFRTLFFLLGKTAAYSKRTSKPVQSNFEARGLATGSKKAVASF
jgi:hypothetical protein